MGEGAGGVRPFLEHCAEVAVVCRRLGNLGGSGLTTMTHETHFKVGAIVEGRYEILSVLGQGGYGVVYKATQLATGQAVAIKLLLTERLSLSADLEAHQARFRRETQLIAGLKHPNIVRLIDSGQTTEGNHMYAVLEYVEGEPLSSLIQKHGPLPVRPVLRLMSQVLEALHHAHSRGVIHRDLKPHNIMVSGDLNERPNAMVLDFGIATLTRGTDFSGVDPRTLTQTGQLYGTPAYMAPEQLQGAATPASDLYAWGLVMVECLTGQPAVKGNTLAEVIYHQISSQNLILPAELAGTGLHTVLERAVQKETSQRYPSASAALSDLERLNTQPLPARLINPQTPSQPVLPQQPQGSWVFSSPQENPLGSASTLDSVRFTPIGQPPGASGVSTHKLPHQPTHTGRTVVWASLVGGLVIGALAVVLWRPWSNTDPILAPVENAIDGTQFCPSGQQITRKTNGQCCWPGQSSNGPGAPCVGIPSSCPQGYKLNDATETCTLLPCHGGRVRMPDGQHCCWQGQAWDSDQNQCVGNQITCDLQRGFYLDHQECFALEQDALTEYQACFPPPSTPQPSPQNLSPDDPPDEDNRNWHACTQLGRRLLIGDGAQPNLAYGAELLDEVCAKIGDAAACEDTARLIQKGLLNAPITAAFHLLQLSCDQGYPRGCYALSQAQQWGIGTPNDTTDPKGACDSLSQACLLNDYLACDQLGLALLPGGRCANPPDVEKAKKNFNRGCNSGKGWPPACTHLGELSIIPPKLPLPFNLGKPPDYTVAQRLWLSACGQNEPLACKRLLEHPPRHTSDITLKRWKQIACTHKIIPCN